MNFYDVQFILDLEDYDYSVIEDGFIKSKNIFNWQFDKNFNATLIDGDIDYQVKDVSNLEGSETERIIDSFFEFTFDNALDVPLYRFLVLKDSKRLKILANISSLIFDYTSINDFYELFYDLNKSYPEKDLNSYYNDFRDYLNSTDFEKDSTYWRNYILNSSDYVKFYNLGHGAYKKQISNVDNDSINNFIKNNDCSLFDFYGSVLSLYLSRIDRTEGCLLKTIIHSKKNDLEAFDKNTFLKVNVNNNDYFSDLLNEFDSAFKNSINHAKIDVDNYLDGDISYYSVYDFSDLNENISVYNGEDSALTLNIYEGYLELVYNSDLFSDVYIEHMARNIESLVNNIINSPDQLVGDMDILSKEEKDLLTNFCKGESVVVDENKFLPNAFRENAIKYPDVVAVDDGINKVTFKELEKSSNSIAYDLKANYNIGHGSRVALMLPRSYHFPELVLALNKIGATFIPVDLFYPLKRIEYMLNVSQARHIVTTEAIANSFGLKEEVILIENLNDTDDVDVDIETSPDELFTIIFTSGTTGLPKGVMVSNSQIPGVGVSFREIFNYSQGDIIGHYLGFTFVASFVLYAALYFGGCCRIFNEQEQKDSLLLVKELKENHMNSLILLPSIGIPIYENEDLQLDYLVLAGAKLNELSKKERHAKLVNFYGTTEIICGVSKIYDLKDIAEGNVPLGSPVANSWVYILDKNNNQMPIGVPGEICVSNKYISQGYLNNPELTDEVFMDNPYCIGEDNERLYHTGDIGFYNFDGEIEIIGREDNQLSVRGFRVESGEILNIMNGFSEISEIYLDVDNDTLIAYYTTNDNLNIDEVKEALNINLPYYMVPSLFIELDEIPLSATGKIDKSLLKTAINNEDIEMADEIISSVVDAFKEVLDLDFVLIDDDFVALGGNSLSAMKLQLLLKERLGVNLSSNELLSLTTPKDIANHIKFNLNVHATVDEDKYTFEDLCPLSESQLNVYLDESVNNMGTAYNNSFKIDFKDKYSVEEIKDALVKLFDVFPVLKARVLNKDGDLSFTFDAEPEIVEGSLNDIRTFVREFELDKYLSRFLIVNDNGSIVLCADFHHLIFDGTSLSILLSRFISILDGDDVDFVDKGVLRQIAFEEIVDSDYMDAAHEFFAGMLADADEVHELLPCVSGDAEFEVVNTFDVGMEYLNSFLQSHSITYNQFFSSVFAYTLSRFTGSDKVLFNIVEDGRGHIDLSESVGMFVRTLPVLMDCKNQDVDSYLEYSSDLINSAMMYDLYPFRLLANEYDLNSNVFFQYSNIFSDVLNGGDLKFSVDELSHDLNADLAFYIFNNGEDKLTIRILYSSVYSKSFMEHFVESYKLILHDMLKVDVLKDINYTSEVDLEILDALNQTEHPLDYNDILDAFNAHLSKYPKNKLVSCNDNSYCYDEGAFIADVVSSKLKAIGVEKGDNVAFLVERSELYMFCVLGILSMGGVYVPLDDAHPDERIEFMLNDAQARVVIVSDETYERAKNLTNDDVNLLNISNIVNGEIGSLSNLPITYGDLACMLYTSGTTGLPKGVKVTRKSILNLSAVYVDKFDFDRNDVYGLFADISFDAGSQAVCQTFYAGACLSIVPDDIKLNVNKLNEYFVEHGVTHAMITTQVGKLFMENVDDTSMEVLTVGGEKLGEFESPEDYILIDGFGPTETFSFVTSINNLDKIDASSIGRLNYNTKAYILDNELRRVPIGAIGELCISGFQVSEGYLNREEETTKSFINNPFDNNDEYNILYRTGDMVRVLPDETLAIVGRRDNQIKIRGNRVELTEVESSIRSMTNVEDVTVQIIENNGNNELVAYIVLSESFDDSDLIDFVREHVIKHKPEYMAPSYVVKLDEIPLNVNGKVDKRALPDVDSSCLHKKYVAPTTENEKIIVEAFEKVFNHQIGIYDDFLRLGGDSLTGIKLLSYIDSNDVTMADIFTFRTPEAIARNMSDLSFDLDLYTLESGCPLNAAQVNVFADVIINNKKNAYHIPHFISIPKEYGLDNILDSLDALLDAHPILCMRLSDIYEVNDTEDVSKRNAIKDLISTTKKFKIENIRNIIGSYGLDVIGISNMLKSIKHLFKGEYPYLVKGDKPPISVKSNADESTLIDFFSESLDLYNYLSKFMIVEYEESYYLFYLIHHIIFDATSAGLFKHDLQVLLDGGSVDLDDTFLKTSAFSQQIKNTEKFEEAREFYQPILSDVGDVGELLPDNSSKGYTTSSYDLEFDKVAFKSFLNKVGIGENVLFTSVFTYTLSQFVDSDKVLFMLIENGRDRFTDEFIGMTSNVMTLVADCKDRSINSFMEHMSHLVYGASRYSYYPAIFLHQDHDFEVNIMFQFVPNWIVDDIEFADVVEGIDVDEFTNQVLDIYSDFLVDFGVQIYQYGETYRLIIINSNMYSDKMINDFKDIYISVLSNIINADMSSNLSDTLK
ncbi:AMP-binding protein [Methanobrevibacter sp.]|uniref:AMP-binding protein n=1 Tax=Methanobrevibacter sp. TaxID=66852 RepID=UPI0038656FBB